MRALIFAAMLIAITTAGWAQEKAIKTDPKTDPRTDSMTVPDAEKKAEARLLFALEEFANKLEEAGFKDVQIGPPAILVQAKDKFDKPILMLINPETMVALQIQSPPANETTGSGPSDDNPFYREDQK